MPVAAAGMGAPDGGTAPAGMGAVAPLGDAAAGAGALEGAIAAGGSAAAPPTAVLAGLAGPGGALGVPGAVMSAVQATSAPHNIKSRDVSLATFRAIAPTVIVASKNPAA